MNVQPSNRTIEPIWGNKMKLSKRQLKRIIREEYSKLNQNNLLSENVCYDEDAIWDCIEDDGEAYAPRHVAEEWMDGLAPRDIRNMTMDTRVTIMYDDQGQECECVKITDRSFRG